MRRRFAVLSTAAAVCASSVAPSLAAASMRTAGGVPAQAASGSDSTIYTATKLQLLPGTQTYDPASIAEDGRVGGYVRFAESVPQFNLPIIWDQSGTPSPLPFPSIYSTAYVLGFDARGNPLGFAEGVETFPGRAGYWDATGFVTLPQLGVGGNAVVGNATAMIGESYDAALSGEVTVWDETGGRLVPGLEGRPTRPYAINADGTFVGVVLESPFRAFVGTTEGVSIVSYPNFNVTQAFDINDSGWFTGLWRDPTGARRAYVARDEEIYDLGLFPGFSESWVHGINNDGTVVGSAANFGFLSKALVWPQGGAPLDLNLLTTNLPPGTILTVAHDINNAGQILVRANDGNYVLTPIPEPAMLSAIAFAGLALRRVRRDRSNPN